MTVNSYHLDFQTTIYGGEAVYNGDGTWTVTVTHANIASYNGESINEPWISSMDAYEAGATPTTGAQVVYPLATPLTYTLTTEELTTLLGQNNVWCDAGEITLRYAEPFTIENPTLFDAKPLLRVYGTGTVGIGDYSFTISAADGYTDIDCDMMDCFKGAVNKNAYVSFTNYKFPVLVPGENVVTMDGVTEIEITPRWYSV